MFSNFTDIKLIMLVIAVGTSVILGFMHGKPWQVGNDWTAKPYVLTLCLMAWVVFLFS